jgi:hypothetical protein
VLPSIGIGLDTSTTKSFVIKNVGKTGNLIGSLTLAQPSAFSITTSSNFDIAPHAAATETVSYTPDATSDTAMLMINSNDATRGALEVKLTGHGFAGKLSAPASFTISGPPDGMPVTSTLTIKNTGKGVLTGSWTGVTTSLYSVTANPLFNIQPNGTQPITVGFTPTVKGHAATATFMINVMSPSTGARTVTLKGIGK